MVAQVIPSSSLTPGSTVSYNETNYTIGQNPDGSYTISNPDSSPSHREVLDYTGLNKDQLTAFFNGTSGGPSALGSNIDSYTAAFGIGDPNFNGSGSPLTQADVAAFSQGGQYGTGVGGFGGGPDGAGGFGVFTPEQLGDNTPGWVKILGDVGFSIAGGLLGGELLGPSLAGVDAVGNAFTGGLGLTVTEATALTGAGLGAAQSDAQGGNPLTAALEGGIGGAISANIPGISDITSTFSGDSGSVNA